MAPTEYVVTGTLMLLGPIVFGVHALVLYLWVVIRQWEAVEGHCGYDLRWSRGYAEDVRHRTSQPQPA